MKLKLILLYILFVGHGYTILYLYSCIYIFIFRNKFFIACRHPTAILVAPSTHETLPVSHDTLRHTNCNLKELLLLHKIFSNIIVTVHSTHNSFTIFSFKNKIRF